MPLNVKQTIAELDAYVAVGEENTDVPRLDAITEGLRDLDDVSLAIPALLGVLERHPDCDLGVPGPIVHTIEAIGNYEQLLIESIRRSPSTLALWMVNRLLNSDLQPSKRLELMELLDSVANDAVVADYIQDEARDFLDYQNVGRNKR